MKIKDFIDVNKCASCGNSHKHLRTMELSKNLRFTRNALHYTHYVTCPNSNQMVFVANTNKDNSA